MVTDDNQTYHGGHFEMNRTMKSLCCIPGANRVLYNKKEMVIEKSWQKQRKLKEK